MRLQDHARLVCNRVGHIHYLRGVNFTADNWLLFKRVVVDSLLEMLTVSRLFSLP